MPDGQGDHQCQWTMPVPWVFIFQPAGSTAGNQNNHPPLTLLLDVDLRCAFEHLRQCLGGSLYGCRPSTRFRVSTRRSKGFVRLGIDDPFHGHSYETLDDYVKIGIGHWQPLDWDLTVVVVTTRVNKLVNHDLATPKSSTSATSTDDQPLEPASPQAQDMQLRFFKSRNMDGCVENASEKWLVYLDFTWTWPGLYLDLT